MTPFAYREDFTPQAYTRFMHIRPARDADRPAICRVHQAAARQLASSSYSLEQIEAWIGALTPDSYIEVLRTTALIVAEDERGILGFGQLDTLCGEVDAVYVDPAVTRLGIGRSLLIALEQIARNCGVFDVHLMATLNAVAFYERAGYTRDAEVLYRTRGGPTMRVVSMFKRLRPGFGSTTDRRPLAGQGPGAQQR